MSGEYIIRPLENNDIELVTFWARNEGFTPGLGDVNIYRHTDTQGLWVGCLDSQPIACIAGVKYNELYGFVGLFIVDLPFRGKGYGLKLWKHVIDKLANIRCLGIEAAPDRIQDYQSWGFKPSSITTRWQVINTDQPLRKDLFSKEIDQFLLLEGSDIQPEIIQKYDENKENSPRPHFLSDWLSHKSGTVIAIVDKNGNCVGFSRIRPCLLKNGYGHRIGPLLADSPFLASVILRNLVDRFPGVILIDSPGINTASNDLFRSLGFKSISHTVRMYKGQQPAISMKEIYGLACLELG